MSRQSKAPYLKLRGSIWYIQWTDEKNVGQKQSTGTKDEVEAEAELGRFLVERIQGPQAVDDKGAAVTVGAAWQTYWERHVMKGKTAPTTIKSLTTCWNNMKPHFAQHRVCEAKGLLEDYVNLRRAGKLGTTCGTDGTIRKEIVQLIAAMNFCSQPRKEIKLFSPEFVMNMIDFAPDENEARDRWLRPWEVNALMEAAASMRKRKDRLSRLEVFLWLALETAGRIEALLELTRDRVDLDVGKSGAIHLDVPGRKKTSKRRASVPISQALRPVLLRALAEMDDQRPNATLLGHKGPIWESLNNAVVKAGINDPGCTDPTKATGVSPHVLRHTAASQMARRGMPLNKIAKILGNSVRQVEKVYAKYQMDDLQDAIDMISAERIKLAETPSNVVQLKAV